MSPGSQNIEDTQATDVSSSGPAYGLGQVPAGDEQTVNLAIVVFLDAICESLGRIKEWSPKRYTFRPSTAIGHNASKFHAEVDGTLARFDQCDREGNKPSFEAIIECKAAPRTPDTSRTMQVQMQETAEFVA
jgi:hypothetical protein